MQDYERDSPCMSTKGTGESKSWPQRGEATKQQVEARYKAAYDSQGSATTKPAKDERCLSADKYDNQPHLRASSRARLRGDAHIAELCRSKAMAQALLARQGLGLRHTHTQTQTFICTHKSYQKFMRIGSLVCVPELFGKVRDIK